MRMPRAVGAVMSRANLQAGTQVVGGVILNKVVTAYVSGLGLVPSMLKTKPGSYALATLVGIGDTALVSMLPQTRRFAPAVAIGTAVDVITKLVGDFILPLIPGIPAMSGIGEYLSRSDAAGARPLGYLDEYLSRSDAAGARPLGDYYGDDYISEELASM
jgi:hypothetical protein